MRTWKTEFGVEYAIPKEIIDLCVERVLIDESWHNDACPSFRVAVTGECGDPNATILWIEHPYPKERESGCGDTIGPRFLFSKFIGETLFGTENLEEAIAFLNKFIPEKMGDGI